MVAFVDPRRLGRIRLCKDPMREPPISLLGFDPLLNMATLEEFSANILKRSCPIKALLLDQSFSAGVGNWVAGTSPYLLFSVRYTYQSFQMRFFIMHISTQSKKQTRYPEDK